MAQHLTRRQVLAAAVVVAVTDGCTANSSKPDTTTSTPPTDADGALRSETVASEIALLALYAAAPDSDLAKVGERHTAYVEALGGSSSTASPPARPATARELIAAERKAADERTQASLTATDPEFVRLLALMAVGSSGAAAQLVAIAATIAAP